MSDKELLFEIKGQTAWLTINRPERRNAISPEVIGLFGEALDEIEKNGDIRVVAVTGTGDKVFCSGADLGSAFASGDFSSGPQLYANLLKRLVSFPRPIVAKLNGHCMAGGLGLMLACDVVYAPITAKFGTPEVGVGLFPMMIGALIFRNVTRKKALELVYTARTVEAPEAEAIGLITRAYPREGIDAAFDSLLADIGSKAPRAIAIGRDALAKAEDMELDSSLDYLCDKLGEVMATEDAMEGLGAFIEKRKPEWKNK